MVYTLTKLGNYNRGSHDDNIGYDFASRRSASAPDISKRKKNKPRYKQNMNTQQQNRNNASHANGGAGGRQITEQAKRPGHRSASQQPGQADYTKAEKL